MTDKRLKADLHIHSQYSMDCQTPLDKIIKRCQALGIGCVAVADHGTAEGGLKLAKIAPASLTVIVAEEVLTTRGEIMGMFLKETVPSGLSLQESIRLIKAQGGLVNIPHPFDTFPRSGIGLEALEEVARELDLIEAFNARSPYPQPSTKALDFALKHKLPTSAGSDAHIASEIGNAFVEMTAFSGKEEFLAALAKGIIRGHKTSPMVHFASMWAKLRRGKTKNSLIRGQDV